MKTLIHIREAHKPLEHQQMAWDIRKALHLDSAIIAACAADGIGMVFGGEHNELTIDFCKPGGTLTSQQETTYAAHVQRVVAPFSSQPLASGILVQ